MTDQTDIQTFEAFDRAVADILFPPEEMAALEAELTADQRTRRALLQVRSKIEALKDDWAEVMLMKVVVQIPADSQLTVRTILAFKALFQEHFGLLIRGRFRGPFVESLRKLGVFCLYHGIAPGPVENGYSAVRDQIYDALVLDEMTEEAALAFRLLTRWSALETFHIHRIQTRFWKIQCLDIMRDGQCTRLPMPHRMLVSQAAELATQPSA